MKYIQTRKQFEQLAQKLGVRHDWHEPDEQGVTVTIKGRTFDNAYGAVGVMNPEDNEPYEKVLIIKQNGKPVAQVNLASLCAWAAGTDT